ncbi:MAG: hypothetical protein ACE5OR_02970 [bacterium]
MKSESGQGRKQPNHSAEKKVKPLNSKLNVKIEGRVVEKVGVEIEPSRVLSPEGESLVHGGCLLINFRESPIKAPNAYDERPHSYEEDQVNMNSCLFSFATSLWTHGENFQLLLFILIIFRWPSMQVIM